MLPIEKTNPAEIFDNIDVEVLGEMVVKAVEGLSRECHHR